MADAADDVEDLETVLSAACCSTTTANQPDMTLIAVHYLNRGLGLSSTQPNPGAGSRFHRTSLIYRRLA
jgi:hypothetical protein